MVEGHLKTKQTYTHEGLRVSEFEGEAAGEHEYILSSSSCAVEPQALRVLFNQQLTRLAAQESEPASTPSAAGRGKVLLITFIGQRLVLRRYRRGGMVAKISSQKYLWTGLQSTRAFGELKVLEYLQQQGLAVCKPFAARIVRRGLSYEASLITHEIENAQTLGSLLLNQQMVAEFWPRTGTLIRQLHDLQGFHADLNAHNIMLSDTEAFLIDFDRGEIRSGPSSTKWKANNVQRLQRSLNKLQQQQGADFSEQNWQALIQAYQS